MGIIPILGAAPVIVLDKEGWAKEAGLDLHFITFESGPNMIQALASGTLDVYVAGVAPLAVARAKGIDVRVVTATAVEEIVMVAGPKLAAYFKPGVSAGQALAAFAAEGKAARLATQPAGSVPNTTLQHWLWEVARPRRRTWKSCRWASTRRSRRCSTGAVDGATIREPAVTIVTQRNPRIKIVALGGEMFPNQPGTVVALSGAKVTKDPKTAAVHRRHDGAGRGPDQVEARTGLLRISRRYWARASSTPPRSAQHSPRRRASSWRTRIPSSRRHG